MKLDVSDLIERKLVTKKTYTNGVYKGLSVLKYTKKVFYDNLWHLDDRLLECRGTVVDEDWNVIVLPFKKVFNYGENGTTVDPDREVIAVEKINGFMAAATMTQKYGLIISTTGSLDSSYAKLARKWIGQLEYSDCFLEGETYLFEICDKSDPHIVEEDEGAYLIGIRDHETGRLYSEFSLYSIAATHSCKRPKTTRLKFKDIPQTEREGFMTRDAATEEVLCKLKSNHYLSKKAIMRLGRAKVDILFDNPELFKRRVDEEFYQLVDFLSENIDKEVFRNYSDQQRRDLIERYFYGC